MIVAPCISTGGLKNIGQNVDDRFGASCIGKVTLALIFMVYKNMIGAIVS